MSRLISKKNHWIDKILSSFLIFMVLEFIVTNEHIMAMDVNSPTEGIVETQNANEMFSNDENSSFTENVPVEEKEGNVSNEDAVTLSRSPSSSSSSSKSSNGSSKKEVPELSNVQKDDNDFDKEVEHLEIEQNSQEIESGEEYLETPLLPKSESPHLSPNVESPKKNDDLLNTQSEDLKESLEHHTPSNKEKEMEEELTSLPLKSEKSLPEKDQLRIFEGELLKQRYGEIIIPQGKLKYVKDEIMNNDEKQTIKKSKSWPSFPRKEFSPNNELSASFSNNSYKIDNEEIKFPLSPKHSKIVKKTSHSSHESKNLTDDIEPFKSETEKHQDVEKKHENPQSPHSSPVKNDNQVTRKTNNPMHHAIGMVRNVSHRALNLIGAPFRFIGGAFSSLKNKMFGKKKDEAKSPKKFLKMHPLEGKEHNENKHENVKNKDNHIHKDHRHQHQEGIEKSGHISEGKKESK